MKPALLVIDVQNEYFAPHGQWVIPEGEEALVRIQALLSTFRASSLPIFHIMHEGLDLNTLVFRSGSIGAQIHPSIEVLAGEQKILKHFPGSFTQTALEAYLRRTECDTLVVCGYMTHMCCDTTTRQASERGFTTLFASDATATRDLSVNGRVVPYQTIQEATLAIMTRFATVLSTADILRQVE